MTETVRTPRIVGLEGPRGFASLCVIVVHTFGLTAPTVTGATHIYLAGQLVAFFFVLSGFLIYLPFCRAMLLGRPAPSLRRYASQRVRRVFPAYLVTFLIANFVLAAVFVVNATDVLTGRSDAGTGRITDPWALLGQVTLVNNLIPSQLQTGINPSWSLTTELCFYLLLPLVAAATATLVRRRGWRPVPLMVMPAIFVAVGIVTKVLLELWQARHPEVSDPTAYFGDSWAAVFTRSLLGQADLFGYGMAVVIIFVTMTQGGLPTWTGRRLQVWCWSLVVLGLAATVVCVELTIRLDTTFFGIACGAAILLIVEPTARGKEARLGRLTDWEPFRLVGVISLSAYLWHYPVLVLMTRWDLIGADTYAGALQSAVVVLAVTLVVSAVSYRFVEKPAMRVAPSATVLPDPT